MKNKDNNNPIEININNNTKNINNLMENDLSLNNNINYEDKIPKVNYYIKNIKNEEIEDKSNFIDINNINEDNNDKIDVTNINEIIELLNDLSSKNNELNIDEFNMNININDNIISNKLKLISILKNLFNNISNYNNNKKILLESIELILDSLSIELSYFFNINTMKIECPKNMLLYISEIISIFYIILSKNEINILLKENILNKLLILFLNYLEIDKEEKISEINNEFNIIIKKINKIALNIIQKSNRDIIYIVLLRLISNFKEESDIALLGINCLVNLIKITNFKKINSINLLTEIIICIDDKELENNNKTNELFLKTIKKILNKLVLEKKYNILKDYQSAINNCNIQDEKFCDWIQKILEHKN